MNARIWKDNKIDIYFYDTGKLENNKNSRSKTVRKRLEKYLINYLIDVGGCKLENNQKQKYKSIIEPIQVLFSLNQLDLKKSLFDLKLSTYTTSQTEGKKKKKKSRRNY